MEEQLIRRNHLLTTIPILKKEWRISFEFKGTNFKGLSQVFHMTAGGKGAGSGAKYGDRTPAIWTHASKGLLISSAVGGQFSYSKFFKPLPTPNEWVRIEVGQELIGSDVIYSISIDKKKVFSIRNSKPSEFKNVKVFSASNWYSPLSGSFRNLVIENKNEGDFTFLSIFFHVCVFRYWMHT